LRQRAQTRLETLRYAQGDRFKKNLESVRTEIGEKSSYQPEIEEKT